MSSVRRSAYVLSVLVLLALGAFNAAHGAAILLSDGREISAFATASTVNEDGQEVDDTDSARSNPSPFDPWSDGGVVASASALGVTSEAIVFQSSSVTPTLFTAEMGGDTFVSDITGDAEATSEFHVRFELATPHSFILTGAGAGTPLGGRRGSFVSLSFGLHEFTGGDLTGILDPGVYDFHARTFTFQLQNIGPPTSTTVFLNFEFALTDLGPSQVPEPSAWLLLGAAVTAGTAGAWFGRRRVRA